MLSAGDPLLISPTDETGDRTESGALAHFLPEAAAGTRCRVLLDGAHPDRNRVGNASPTGTTLRDAMRDGGRDLLGRFHPAEVFPLTLRIREIGDSEPLLVCGGDDRLLGRPAESLFWYCLPSPGTVEIAAGLRPRVTRGQFLSRLGSSALRDLLEVFSAPCGDALFVAPGVPFWAGPGCLLLEVTGPGNRRLPLATWSDGDAHLDAEALSLVSFSSRRSARIRQDTREVNRTRRIPLITICPEFEVDEIRIVDYFFERAPRQTPDVLCAVDGVFELESNGTRVEFRPGCVVVVPAAVTSYRVAVDGKGTLLRIVPRFPI